MLPCTFPFPSTTNRLHSPLPALTLPSSPPALYHQDSGTSNQANKTCLLMSFVQLIHSTGGQQLCASALGVCHISEHAGPFPTADTHGVSPIFLLEGFSSTSSPTVPGRDALPSTHCSSSPGSPTTLSVALPLYPFTALPLFRSVRTWRPLSPMA